MRQEGVLQQAERRYSREKRVPSARWRYGRGRARYSGNTPQARAKGSVTRRKPAGAVWRPPCTYAVNHLNGIPPGQLGPRMVRCNMSKLIQYTMPCCTSQCKLANDEHILLARCAPRRSVVGPYYAIARSGGRPAPPYRETARPCRRKRSPGPRA